MTEHVLAALLALAPWHGDRDLTREERAAILAPVAQAISAVVRNDQEAAALIAQGWHESRYASHVLAGRCDLMPRGQRCDPDRNGAPRARGPWQLWRVACRDDGGGLHSEAACALRLLRGGRQRCTNGWLGAFAAMRGTWSCVSKQGPVRVATMRESLQRIAHARWVARQEGRGS